jgi:hypothetical protein
MSGSEQHDRVFLEPVDDQACIGGIVKRNLMGMVLAERLVMLKEAQEMLRWVAQYMECTSTAQRVCDTSTHIISLHEEITEPKSHQFLHPQWDGIKVVNQIWTLTTKQDSAKRRPAAPETDKELQLELPAMCQITQQSGDTVHGVWAQLANALTLVV